MRYAKVILGYLQAAKSIGRAKYFSRSCLLWAILLPFIVLLSDSGNFSRTLGLSAENASIVGLMLLFTTVGLGVLLSVANLYLMIQRLKDVVEARFSVLKMLPILLVLGYLIPSGLILLQLLFSLLPGKHYFDQFEMENRSLVVIEGLVLKIKTISVQAYRYLNSKISLDSLRTFFKS